jgi:hypothetical protein
MHKSAELLPRSTRNSGQTVAVGAMLETGTMLNTVKRSHSSTHPMALQGYEFCTDAFLRRFCLCRLQCLGVFHFRVQSILHYYAGMRVHHV